MKVVGQPRLEKHYSKCLNMPSWIKKWHCDFSWNIPLIHYGPEGHLRDRKSRKQEKAALISRNILKTHQPWKPPSIELMKGTLTYLGTCSMWQWASSAQPLSNCRLNGRKKKKKNCWVDNLASSLPGLMCSVFLHKKETLYPRISFLPSSQTQTHT